MHSRLRLKIQKHLVLKGTLISRSYYIMKLLEPLVMVINGKTMFLNRYRETWETHTTVSPSLALSSSFLLYTCQSEIEVVFTVRQSSVVVSSHHNTWLKNHPSFNTSLKFDIKEYCSAVFFEPVKAVPNLNYWTESWWGLFQRCDERPTRLSGFCGTSPADWIHNGHRLSILSVRERRTTKCFAVIHKHNDEK